MQINNKSKLHKIISLIFLIIFILSTITINSNITAVDEKIKITEREIEWNITLNIIEESGKYAYIVFGEAIDANDGLPIDVYDTPMPPPSPTTSIYAYFRTNFTYPHNYLWKEYKSYPDTNKVWNLSIIWINSDTSNTSINISWNPFEINNTEYNFIELFHNETKITQNMFLENNYRFNITSNIAENFKIICKVVENSPPQIPSNPNPISGQNNVEINYNLSWNCSDPNGDPLTYDVFFGNTTSPQIVLANQSNNIYYISNMSKNTTYFWRIVAWDDKNTSNSGPIWNFTTVTNIAPISAFTYYPNIPIVNHTIIFTDNSTDIDGIITNYSWDFGDGFNSYEKNPLHTYQNLSNYLVSLTVTDENGAKNITTRPIITKSYYNYNIYNGINTVNFDNLNLDINANLKTNLTIEHFSDNLKSGGNPNSFVFLNSYYNISIENNSCINWPIEIRIFYSQYNLNDSDVTEDSLLGIYFWDETSNQWILYEDTGVNTVYNENGFEGYCWANAMHFTFISTGGDNQPPSKVTGLTVTDAKDGKLDLSWNAATDNFDVSYYKIYRDGAFIIDVTSTSYQDTELINDQSYIYQISAFDLAGNEGEKSNPISGVATETTSSPPGGGTSGGSTGGDTGGGDTGGSTNQYPVANASSGEPYTGFIYEEITFDGSLSNDPDGNITVWLWDFGDNQSDRGEIVTHLYTKVGTYQVLLTVSDEDNASDTYETYVIVSQPNIPPSPPNIIGERYGKKNLLYNYTISSTDDNNDLLKYNVDWGDGILIESEFLSINTSFVTNHSWTSSGKYEVDITVEDNYTTTSTSIIVMIDAINVEDIGYLTDEDGDGIYDIFYGVDAVTNLGRMGKIYLIDSNGNGKWDYIFDLNEGLDSYKIDNNTSWMVIIPLLFVLLIIFVVFILVKKDYF